MGLNLEVSNTTGEAQAEVVFAGLLSNSCERPVGGNILSWKWMISSKGARIQGGMVFQYTKYIVCSK